MQALGRFKLHILALLVVMAADAIGIQKFGIVVLLPLLYAMQKADESDRRLIREAVRAGHGDFQAIEAVIEKTGTLKRSLATAHDQVRLGKEAIEQLPGGLFRDSLIKFLTLAVDRDF